MAIGLGAGALVPVQVGPLVGIGATAKGRSGQPEGVRELAALLREAIAAESPAVLVIEDLHWADDALLD